MKKILSTVAVVLAAVMLLSVSVFAGDEFVLRFKDCKNSEEDGTTVFPHGGFCCLRRRCTCVYS